MVKFVPAARFSLNLYPMMVFPAHAWAVSVEVCLRKVSRETQMCRKHCITKTNTLIANIAPFQK